MNNYIKQFRPLTSDDVEFIRKKQGGIKDIGVLLQKDFFLDNEEINLVLTMMPQLNTSVEEYYIQDSIIDMNTLPVVMIKELFDVYFDAYLNARKIKTETGKSTKCDEKITEETDYKVADKSDFSKIPPLQDIKVSVLDNEDTILGTVRVNFNAIKEIKEKYGINIVKLMSEQLFYEIEKLVTLRNMKKVEKEIFNESESEHEKLLKYEKFINTFLAKFERYDVLFKPLDTGLDLAYNILDELTRKGKPNN